MTAMKDRAMQNHATFGEQMLNSAYRFLLIEAHLKGIEKPHVFFQVLKNFLHQLARQDPNQFHYDIAKKSIELS